MKSFFKGFGIQLFINIFAHIIRIVVAYLIIKYAPEPSLPTSFGKDTGWQILSLFSIIIYNIFSMIIFIIKYIKNKNENALGFSTMSVLAGIYAWLFCGLV